MSLKETAEQVKQRKKEIFGELRETIKELGGAIPKPLEERPTLIIREPLVKRLRRLQRLGA